MAVESATLMRIQILSDLHLEFPGNILPPLAPDAELVIIRPGKPASTRMRSQSR